MPSSIYRRVRAPLRRIVVRDIEVFELHHGLPTSFSIREHLECGHHHVSLLWDSIDLINAYTDNPAVTARRRECRDCMEVASCANNRRAA